MSLLYYILLASGLKATTYGWGSSNCGDIGKPRPCVKGAPMANGEPLDPDVPTAAIALPTNMRLQTTYIWLQVRNGPCVRIRLTDKMNPRYIGKRSFDLTKKAIELLTGTVPTKHWSDVVYVCKRARPYEKFLHRFNDHPLINSGIQPYLHRRPRQP